MIIRRIQQMQAGNFGDHKFVGDGVAELRINFGPGYRLYYGMSGKTVVLLLCGGDKDSQKRDIMRAKEMIAGLQPANMQKGN